MKPGKKKEIIGIQTGNKETEPSPHAHIFVYEENFTAWVKASVSLPWSQDTRSTYKNQPYFHSPPINKW